MSLPYLRARACTHGIFLVGIVGDTHWLDPDNGAKLTFDDVMGRLRLRASELEFKHRNQGVEAIRVVSLDFRTPVRRPK